MGGTPILDAEPSVDCSVKANVSRMILFTQRFNRGNRTTLGNMGDAITSSCMQAASTRAELLLALCDQIDADARQALRCGDPTLVVGDFNRATLLRMLRMGGSLQADGPLEEGALRNDEVSKEPRLHDDGAFGECRLRDGEQAVDSASVRLLVEKLGAFLAKYMADKPEGHRWIVLACVFLAFVVNEPMHPQAVVGWEEVSLGVYVCPAHEGGEGSLCRWCACGPAQLPE